MKNNILILGAKSDIAQATAYEFAKKGFNITLASRNASELVELVSDLEIKHNIEVSNIVFDALKYESHFDFFNTLKEKPTVVLCAFGYLGEQEKAEKEFTEAKQIIEVNYLGAVSILNVVSNYFEEQKQGTIIGISSVAGERGRQSNYFYGSAKAGFTAYLSGLRNRLVKSSVHVVTVNPGFVDTKMTYGLDLPKPVTAKPEQVASSIFKAFKKQKNIIYTLWMWRYIMMIIKSIPEFIFKKLSL